MAQSRPDCSQSFAFGFYLSETNSDPPPEFPTPNNAAYTLGKFTLNQEWTYRKVSSLISLQAWGGTHADGNDYPFGSALLDSENTLTQRSDWRGGLNMTSLRNAEAFAKGFATFVRSLWVNNSESSTDLSLSKFAEAPYLRDTRRSASGLDSFVLSEKDMASSATSPVLSSCTWYYHCITHSSYHCALESYEYRLYHSLKLLLRYTLECYEKLTSRLALEHRYGTVQRNCSIGNKI